MASKQTMPDNNVIVGGSLCGNSQDHGVNLQNQTQIQKDLRQFIVKIMDQKLGDFKQEIMQEVKQLVYDMKGTLQEKCNKLQGDLIIATKGLSEAIIETEKKADENNLEVQSKLKAMDYKISIAQNKLQEMENQLTLIQFRLMESAIRLRGIRECNTQDLRRVCADFLAGLLRIRSEEISCRIEQIYRVNSHVAKEKQLPRDVVIHFTDKKMRKEILQKSFVSALHIEGKKIEIFKELPPKMLSDRKSFGFLVTELKKRHILFRWDAPVGIILWFQGKRYQLNTVEKAEDFYYNVLTSDPISSSTLLVQEEEKEKYNKHDLKAPCNQMEKEAMETQQECGEAQDQSKEQQWQRSKPSQVKNKKWKRSHKPKRF